MKRLFFTFITGAALFTMSITNAKAQDYKTAAGLAIDFGDGATLVGPHIKHFFLFLPPTPNPLPSGKRALRFASPGFYPPPFFLLIA